MEIMETPIGDEVDKIIEECEPEVYYWSATLHSAGYDYDALKVINIDDVRNYERKFCPELAVTLFLSWGKYAYRLMPNIHQTEITLHRIPVMPSTGGFDPDDTKIAHERFTVVVDNTDAPQMEANAHRKLDEEGMDLSNACKVTLRLLPMAMEQYRLLTMGGIYRKIPVEDVIKNILITQSRRLKLPAEYMPKGVDMVKPKDKAPREHYLIPHGMRSTDTPAYVHKHCGGVYSNGFSYFYQNDFWFVWPTFDHTRFNEVEDTLTVINIPANQFPSLEKTWRLEKKALIVLSTSQVTASDSTEHNQQTSGNGTRFTQAGSLKEWTVETKDNRALMSRAKHNNEFVIDERFKGMNVVTTSESHITDNKHYELSSMTVKDGVIIVMRWENASPERIRPGMQARIMYLDMDNIATKYGVVIGVNINTELAGQAITASLHISTVDIILFCERVVF